MSKTGQKLKDSFKEATASVRDQFKPEIGEDFYTMCVNLVEEYRAGK